jgi:hypothetical protein
MIQIGDLDNAKRIGYASRMAVLGVFQIKKYHVFRPIRCLYHPLSDFPTFERIFTSLASDDPYWWGFNIETYIID